MNAVWIVARKELRGAFQSPVALLFLAVFLLVTLFSFFTGSRFFARNIADVRPLFEWLPLLLILLVSAATMRMWAEERKMGTLELMMTLPLRTADVVLGKFTAAVALVAIGLALTLPLPVMVSWLGPLDWGPVVGGYMGALLLGAAYAAIGLAVSARTDNQVVALMSALALGGALYLVGAEPVVSLVGSQTGALLAALGTGARFESIARGVIDARDLVYYGTVTVAALLVNVMTLERQRIDRSSGPGKARLTQTRLVAGAILANLVLLNVWLAPVGRARVDLTAAGEFSISHVTRDTLGRLSEPLFIEGYFSERTHPLLQPLVPQIQDVLQEYRIAGNGRVQLSFADPNTDPELEERLQSDYGVSSFPFRVEDRTQQSVVNSYFHIVVRYGDQYQTLSFGDLVEVQMSGQQVDVRLRNLEYDLTRAIRKVTQEFTPIGEVVASMPAPATLSLYVTPDTLPEGLQSVPEFVRNVANELAAESGGNFRFVETNPAGDASLQRRLAEQYAIQPMAVDLFGTQTFYLDLVMENGTRAERIVPRGELTEGDIRRSIEASLRRMTPGQLTTVGLFTDNPAPSMDPNIPPQFQQPPAPADFQILEQYLGESFQVERVDLTSGLVPGYIDTLVVARPGDVSDEELFAIDQFLMRGGSLLVMAGRYAIEAGRTGLQTVPTDADLLALLQHWGVAIGDGFVMDTQSALFPVPVREQRGGMTLERIQLIPYPLFPDVRSDGFDDSHPTLSGLSAMTVPWASPLTVTAPEGVTAVELLRSTGDSWFRSGSSIEPNFSQFPETGFGRLTESTGAQVLATALTGSFQSWYADRPSPLMEGSADASSEGSADFTGQTLERSPADARLVVVGSASVVGDLMMQLAQQPGGEAHRSNVQFVENLLDWSVQDTELMQIRGSGAFARTLRPLDDSQRQWWELAQVAVGLMLLGALAVIPQWRRRRVVSFASEVRA
jgi:ABC-2 type transport system permease protein